MSTFSTRVRAARQAAGMSKRALNRVAFGVDNATNITRLESGSVSHPRTETLESVALACDVSLDWLASGRIGATERTYAVAGIGSRIQRARESAGLSARALAQASGLGESAQNVRRLETGAHYPTRNTVERLAEVLGRRASRLAYGT